MQPAYKLRRRIRERAAFVAAIRARHQAEAVSRDASVGAESGAVRAAGDSEHAADCASTCKVLQSLEVGPSEGGVEGPKAAFRNAGVTASGAGA